MPEPILGLPAGWTVLESAVNWNNPRDGYVLCERMVPRRDSFNFVTWCFNSIEGGCFSGNYHETLEKARSDFIARRARL